MRFTRRRRSFSRGRRRVARPSRRRRTYSRVLRIGHRM